MPFKVVSLASLTDELHEYEYRRTQRKGRQQRSQKSTSNRPKPFEAPLLVFSILIVRHILVPFCPPVPMYEALQLLVPEVIPRSTHVLVLNTASESRKQIRVPHRKEITVASTLDKSCTRTSQNITHTLCESTICDQPPSSSSGVLPKLPLPLCPLAVAAVPGFFSPPF